MLHEHRAHVEVLVEEPAGLGPVGADPSDHGRQVDHDVGLGSGQQPLDVCFPGEIVLGFARRLDVPASRIAKGRNHMTPEKTSAAGDQNSAVSHRCPPLRMTNQT